MRLIDADALAETLGITDMSCERCAWYDRTKSLCGRGGDFEDACAAIEDAPTVEEWKTGKWRAFKIGECDLIECTACKVARPREEMPRRNGGKIAWKYCPECGARMEE